MSYEIVLGEHTDLYRGSHELTGALLLLEDRGESKQARSDMGRERTWVLVLGRT